MLTYYVVYSLRTDKGTGVGRTSVSCSKPIDSMARVNDVEASILADIKETKESTAENVFLTFWQPIKPDPE